MKLNKIFGVLFLMIMSLSSISAQTFLTIGAGKTLSGYGDLTGNSLGIGLKKTTNKKLNFKAHFSQSGLRGQHFSITGGTNNIGWNYYNQGKLSFDNRLDSIYKSNNNLFKGHNNREKVSQAYLNLKELSFGLGYNLSLNKRLSIQPYVIVSTTLLNLRYGFGFFNDRDNQGNFVYFSKEIQTRSKSIGYGYGLDINYLLTERVGIALSGAYIEYIKYVQNTASLGVQLNLQL